MTGYFDGDGCVSLIEKGRGLRINLTFVGTLEMMVWIQKLCDQIAPPISGREGSQARAKERIAIYGVSGRRAEIIARKVLTLKIPKLARKWDKIIQRFLDLKDKKYTQLTLF
ncbi:hypothetical protein ACE1CI_17235 [Aerosakkonemataceae cyanobacterium BLCC-F50]|uniref:Homing endonuclease LAGLIDADG domain-containing protein n=1 Tax=Floridaenema flaviceps BLCC-F50 TaxID=3153642 RepID=A0ABV4XSF8_9CYAN